MPDTPHFGWHTPVLSDEADPPADFQSLAQEIEDVVHNLPPNEIGNAGAEDAGKLLVVGPGGVNAWRMMTGDATLSSVGAFTIGAEKITSLKIQALAITEALLAGEAVSAAKIKDLAVTTGKLATEGVTSPKLKALAVTTAKLDELAVTTAKLANLAVTEAKLADGAVGTVKLADSAATSRKLKPTTGLKQATGSLLALSTSYQDIASTTLEITPDVASYLRIWAAFGLQAQNLEGAGEGEVLGAVNLDGSDLTSPLARMAIIGSPSVAVGTYPANHVIALTAAKHTIKLRAKKNSNAQFAFVNPTYTYFAYDLVAS